MLVTPVTFRTSGAFRSVILLVPLTLRVTPTLLKVRTVLPTRRHPKDLHVVDPTQQWTFQHEPMYVGVQGDLESKGITGHRPHQRSVVDILYTWTIGSLDNITGVGAWSYDVVSHQSHMSLVGTPLL